MVHNYILCFLVSGAIVTNTFESDSKIFTNTEATFAFLSTVIDTFRIDIRIPSVCVIADAFMAAVFVVAFSIVAANVVIKYIQYLTRIRQKN